MLLLKNTGLLLAGALLWLAACEPPIIYRFFNRHHVPSMRDLE